MVSSGKNDFKNKMDRFVKCAKIPIMQERMVFTGCLEISQFVERALDKVGLQPKSYVGYVDTFEGKRIPHVWVEVDNYVIETNPSQILGGGVLKAMKRDEWKKITKPSDIIPFKEHPLYRPTSQGERFYGKLAEDTKHCFI